MACSLGAVFGGLLMAGDAFDNLSSAELGSLVRGAVHDLVAQDGCLVPTDGQRNQPGQA